MALQVIRGSPTIPPGVFSTFPLGEAITPQSRCFYTTDWGTADLFEMDISNIVLHNTRQLALPGIWDPDVFEVPIAGDPYSHRIVLLSQWATATVPRGEEVAEIEEGDVFPSDTEDVTLGFFLAPSNLVPGLRLIPSNQAQYRFLSSQIEGSISRLPEDDEIVLDDLSDSDQ